MTWTPDEKPDTRGPPRHEIFASAQPLAGTGCQKLSPASGGLTATAPLSSPLIAPSFVRAVRRMMAQARRGGYTGRVRRPPREGERP